MRPLLLAAAALALLAAPAGAQTIVQPPFSGGTLTGPLTAPGITSTGAIAGQALTLGGTPVVLGTDVGDTVLLANHSGFPGINITKRWILQNTAPTATDFTDFQFDRITTFSGGTSANINSNIKVTTVQGTNDGTQEWNILGVINSNDTTGVGLPVAAYFQANRAAAGKDHIWSIIGDTKDQSDLSSSASGTPGLVTTELDISANGADDAANSSSYGGFGNRSIAVLVADRYNTTDTAQTQISHGIWVTTGDSHVNYGSVLSFGGTVQTYNVIDSRGAVAPTGSANPVMAVVMSAGQVIDFSGGAALNSAPGRSLSYSTTDTALEYKSGATTLLAINDSGALTINGGPSLLNASGALALATTGGTQAEILNTASAANYITLTGGATGADPILSVGGADAARNLVLQPKGSGNVVINAKANLGGNAYDYIQVSGAALGGSPSISAVGGDTNVPLTLKGKGTGGIILASLPTSCSGGTTGTIWNNSGVLNVCP